MKRLLGICPLVMGLMAISAFAQCPINTVESGNICVDRYEDSIWETTNPLAIQLIETGQVVNAQQLINLGAVQRGVNGNDYGAACPDNGAGCKTLYAVPLPRVKPSMFMNWFQAAAVCRNAGKRLLTNAEWQAAALGTPDPGASDNMTTECNVGTSGQVALTGSRGQCVSDVHAHDMAGNVAEFVADWGAVSTMGNNWSVWSANFGGDSSIVGVTTAANPLAGLPAATLRGGGFAIGSAGYGALAGVYAIDQNGLPASQGGPQGGVGVRCGK